MIRIIKQPLKRTLICKHCFAELEYEKEDVIRVQTGIQEFGFFIICPCCNKRNEVTI